MEKEEIDLEFLSNIFQSEGFRYLMIMLGFHVVLGMFGFGCCGSKKRKKNVDGTESREKSCH